MLTQIHSGHCDKDAWSLKMDDLHVIIGRCKDYEEVKTIKSFQKAQHQKVLDLGRVEAKFLVDTAHRETMYILRYGKGNIKQLEIKDES